MNNVFLSEKKRKCLGNVHIIVVATKYSTQKEILISVVYIFVKQFPTIDGKGIEIHRMI